jgi:hypothetical protein
MPGGGARTGPGEPGGHAAGAAGQPALTRRRAGR